MSGAGIAAEIAAALREAGSAVGNGPLLATIKRAGLPTGPEWNPTPGTPVEFTVTVVESSSFVKDASGTLTGEVIRKLMVEAGVTVPLKGDTINLRGVDHTVDSVRTVAPGGVDLLYEVVLER